MCLRRYRVVVPGFFFWGGGGVFDSREKHKARRFHKYSEQCS